MMLSDDNINKKVNKLFNKYKHSIKNIKKK